MIALATIRMGLVLLLSASTIDAGAPDAGALDAGAAALDAGSGTPASSTAVVDFTDDEGIAGGDELTSAPPEPLEHESLLPERYRDEAVAPPAPAQPKPPRKRGCGGCGVARGDGAAGGLAFAALALVCATLARRRAGRGAGRVPHRARKA